MAATAVWRGRWRAGRNPDASRPSTQRRSRAFPRSPPSGGMRAAGWPCCTSSTRCAEMVKPGGLMIAATLNRTFKSFALAIVGAEYVLRWLPRGTHQWDKFVTPNELEATLERHGLRVIDETGVIYDLLADRWRLSSDMDVNYMVVAERAPS